jgi:hypothetical protein
VLPNRLSHINLAVTYPGSASFRGHGALETGIPPTQQGFIPGVKREVVPRPKSHRQPWKPRRDRLAFLIFLVAFLFFILLLLYL